MTASRIGWGWNLVAKILHRAGFATGLAVLCALMAPAAPAWAQAQGAFTVRDVPVDATAENAAKAREVALSQGQQTALRRLLERLTPAEVHGSLPSPSAEETEGMVLGLSLSNEKTSNVRYLADMTVRFMPDAVRSLLDQTQLPYVADAAPAVVVLPVWRTAPDSAPVLWEEPNPWRLAWTTLPRTGLQPVEAPIGDLEDIMAADAATVAQSDPADLRAYADRYGTSGVMVAEATQRSGAIEVSATTDNGGAYKVSITPQEGESLTDTLRRAAESLRGQMEADWKARQAMASTGGQGGNTLTALVPISSMHDWLSVRRALEEARGIGAWTLQALTRDRAQVSLSFRGDAATHLSDALAPYGLSARPQDGYWLIEKAGAGGAGYSTVQPSQPQAYQTVPAPETLPPPAQETQPQPVPAQGAPTR